MSYHVIIPARYASTRLPGKPLADIAGKPMIQHVVEAAGRSTADSVTVATDDQRIFDAVQGFGGKVVMTREDHASGTDRLQETAQLLALEDDAIVVNIQGDEPLLPPQVISQVAENLAANPWAAMATLCEPIHEVTEYLNPNAVKVVFADDGRALYFSRSPMPMARDITLGETGEMPSTLKAYRHVGIYAYRVSFLHDYVGWPAHALELTEKLEQLRAMAHGAAIHVDVASASLPPGVDTPEDLARVSALLAQ
jgi:3-deoxy-manno-octulosonate cytidylyltransferase (CMP-KDO synthetase)